MTRRNTRSTPTQPKIEPKVVVAVARKTKTKTKTRAATTSPIAPEPAPAPIQSLSLTGPKAPSGKLGALLEQIGQPIGATIDQLADATGWQAHTIRAAFSRLRQRGFPIILVTDAEGRKAYQFDSKEG